MSIKAQQEFLSGQRMRDHQRLQEAENLLVKASEMEPANADYHGWLAEVYARERKLDQAVAHADKALELDAKCGIAYVARGRVFYEQGNLAAALRETDTAISVQPDCLSAYRQAVFLCGSAGNSDRMVKTAEQVRMVAPQSFEAAFTEAQAKHFSGDYPGAAAAYEQAVAVGPENLLAYVNLGTVREKLGDLRGAESDFSKALSINGEYGSAFTNRADVRTSLKDYQGALADLDRVIELDPENVLALAKRAELKHQHLDDFRGVIQDCYDVIQIEPQHKWAYALRGDACRRLGECERAIEDFDQALRIDPEFAWALSGRAFSYGGMDDLDNSLIDMARYYQLRPKAKLALENPDSQSWHDQAHGHFSETLLPELRRHSERFVEYWECYLAWGRKARQTMYEGTTKYVHEAMFGAGYVCVTDRAVRIVSLGDVTSQFVKKRGLMGRAFGATLGNLDMSRRKLSDQTWTMSYRDIVGVSDDSDSVVLDAVSETWQIVPLFEGESAPLIAALTMARDGKLADIWRPQEPDATGRDASVPAQTDVFEAIKKLAELRDLGAISEDEYQIKKTELLGRL